ncbi:MAG: hypothetical protein Q4B68_06075 [Bacteroidales bacterium]|nr:hypothetical protein [Bacteroidales bacterium]
MNEGVRQEVEGIVTKMGSSIDEWVSENKFIDTHGCYGYIFLTEEEAYNSVLYGQEHQYAIDNVDGAQSDEEWIEYLIHGGVPAKKAKQIIDQQNWDEVVRIIVNACGPEWFLADYSGEVYSLSDGSILYY